MKHTVLLVAALLAASCSTNRQSATVVALTDSLTLTTNQLHHRNQILDLTADTRLTIDSIRITLPPVTDGTPSPQITLKGLKTTTRSHRTTRSTDTVINQTAAIRTQTTKATQSSRKAPAPATNPLLHLTLLIILSLLLSKLLIRK